MRNQKFGPMDFIFIVAGFLFLSISLNWLFSMTFPNFDALEPRVQHRVICVYEGGEQKGDVCVRNDEVIEIDLSNFKEE